MKLEPTVSSETSAIRTQTPGNYPKRNKLQIFITFPKKAVAKFFITKKILGTGLQKLSSGYMFAKTRCYRQYPKKYATLIQKASTV